MGKAKKPTSPIEVLVDRILITHNGKRNGVVTGTAIVICYTTEEPILLDRLNYEEAIASLQARCKSLKHHARKVARLIRSNTYFVTVSELFVLSQSELNQFLADVHAAYVHPSVVIRRRNLREQSRVSAWMTTH